MSSVHQPKPKIEMGTGRPGDYISGQGYARLYPLLAIQSASYDPWEAIDRALDTAPTTRSSRRVPKIAGGVISRPQHIVYELAGALSGH